MPYEFRVYPPPEAAPVDDPAFRAWLNAVARGFHVRHTSEAGSAIEAELCVAEQWTTRAVYAKNTPTTALGADHPVATFAEWPGELSLGAGRTVPVHQISDVTVRQTHRRHGLLTRLMRDSLTTAHDNGVPVAALTVTEATIYGRFGFGPATFAHQITVDAGPRFNITRSPSGTVEYVDLADLAAVADRVFEAFHLNQAGSIRRNARRRLWVTGEIDRETNKPSAKVRAAAHWDDQGVVDGYVTWHYVGEFGKEQLTVLDLVATNHEAHLGLWAFLGTSDLVEKVHWHSAPVDDPLPWALADRWTYAVHGSKDSLWLRVLDPVRLFTTRHYAQDGVTSFHVVDPLDFASGAWRLEVVNGHPTMTAIPAAEAELDVDVAALGSLLLGGFRAGLLAGAGLVRGEADQVANLNRLLLTPREPRCLTPF